MKAIIQLDVLLVIYANILAVWICSTLSLGRHALHAKCFSVICSGV